MRPSQITICLLISFAAGINCALGQKTLSPSSEKYEIYLSDGVSMLHRHRFDMALGKFDEALKLKPKSAHALSLKARALRHLNRTDEALAAIKTAKEFEPKSVQPYLSLASFCLKDRNIAKAKEYLAQAEKVEPHNYEVAGLMATCLVQEKNYKGALVYVNEAVKEHPDAHRVAQRAAIYRMLGDRKNELIDYDKAVALDPKSPAYATERATTLFQTGKLQQGMSEVNRAISLDDKFAPAYFIRANINWVLRQAPLALADLNKALAMEENGGWYHFRGSIYEVKREYRAALNDQLKADKLFPDQAIIKASISRLYHRLLEPKPALEYITAAIKLDPKNSQYYDERSQIYRTMMEYELALADDTRSIECSRKPPINALVNRVRYYRATKRFDLALKDQNRIISYFPRRVGLKEARAQIYFERGEATHKREDYLRSREDFDQVLSVYPNDVNLGMSARVNLKLGNLTKALADVNQAIVKQPGMSSYYLVRADIHKAMGKSEEARKDLAAAKAADDAALPPH